MDFLEERYVKSYINICSKVYREITENCEINDYTTNTRSIDGWIRDFEFLKNDPILKIINDRNLKGLKYIYKMRPEYISEMDIDACYNYWQDGYVFLCKKFYNLDIIQE